MSSKQMPMHSSVNVRTAAVVILLAASVVSPTATPATGERMAAIVYHEYGTADVLRLEEIERPALEDDRVLVKVRAAAANPLDWHYMRGTPYVMRIETGLFEPKSPRLGVDLAGEVVAVGRNVTRFKPGDEVFGAAGGAFAEFVRAREDRIVHKPGQLTFQQAAGVPVAALTALQGLRDKGRLQPGDEVLIVGASGGVGTFAVQIAKAYGARVTAVCSTRNVQLVRSLGADAVIDYTQEDFSQSDQRYDVVMDNVGIHPLSAFRRVLVDDGIAVLIGGGGPDEGHWIGPLSRPVKALAMSPFVSQELVFFTASINRDDLLVMKQLMESGKVTPVIDRTYRLDEVPEAIRYLETGRARGKVIIDVAGTRQNGDR